VVLVDQGLVVGKVEVVDQGLIVGIGVGVEVGIVDQGLVVGKGVVEDCVCVCVGGFTFDVVVDDVVGLSNREVEGIDEVEGFGKEEEELEVEVVERDDDVVDDVLRSFF